MVSILRYGTINCFRPLEINVCKIFSFRKLLKLHDKTQTVVIRMACLCELTLCLYHPKKQLIIKHYFFAVVDVGLNLEEETSLLFYSDNQNFCGGLHMVSNR